MVMNDNEKIQKLYESIRKVDYFELDEKDFDFDKFMQIEDGFMDYNGGDLYGYLLEGFEEVESNDENRDAYLVTLHNGLKFHLHLNYLSPSKTKEFVATKKTSAEQKGDNELSGEYVKSFSNLKEDDIICMVMFADEKGRTDRTGEVKMNGKELFITLKKGILFSWHKRGMDKIKALVMRVDKNDIKRLNFYKLLINKYMPNFPNIFEDRITEIKEGNILLITTK